MQFWNNGLFGARVSQKKQDTGIVEVTGAKKNEYIRGNTRNINCLSFARNICIEAVTNY